MTSGIGGGHKSKAQRQQEAKERLRKHLPRYEDSLREAAGYLAKHAGDKFAQEEVERQKRSLVAKYVQAGYDDAQAQGMARAVAGGGSASTWLSGAEVEGREEKSQEPETAEEVVSAIKMQGKEVLQAVVAPHPFRPAIRVWVTTRDESYQVVADMSILQMDKVIAALNGAGIKASRDAVAQQRS